MPDATPAGDPGRRLPGIDQVLLAAGRTWPQRLADASEAVTRRAAADEPLPAAPTADRARRLAQAWRAAVEPAGSGSFERRLAWDGLTEADIPLTIPAAAEDPPGCAPPWLADLQELRQASADLSTATWPQPREMDPDASSTWLAWLDTQLPDGCATGPDAIPFAHLFVGFVQVASRWASLPDHDWLSAQAAADLRRGLLIVLAEIAQQALLADFAGARTAGETLLLSLGPPVGLPSREGYGMWVRDNLSDGFTRILRKYPVLGRLWAQATRQWAEQVQVMLRRVGADRGELYEGFGLLPSASLVGVEWGCSDPHRGGRTVAILTFGLVPAGPPSGPQGQASAPGDGMGYAPTDQRRIVYKPKDLRLEAWFSELVTDIAARLPAPGWTSAPVLCRADPAPPPGPGGDNNADRCGASHSAANHHGTTNNLRANHHEKDPDAGDRYGYAAFVAHAAALTPKDRSEFYVNAGHLLCLLHLLGATDCHFENLIAAGASLVLIDAETLFEAAVRGIGPSPPERPPDASRDFIGTSVLRTGLLPRWELIGRSQTPWEVSGLGVVDVPGFARPRWNAPNTDDMARDGSGVTGSAPEVPPARATSSPWPESAVAELGRHGDDVVAGYVRAYQWIRTPRNRRWLEEQLDRCVGVSRRVVLRATRIYAVIGQEGCSPSALADVDQRAAGFERLARAPILSEVSAGPWIFGCEVNDLESGDIPYFDHLLGDTRVAGSLGAAEGILVEDGLQAARDRLRRLDDSDLDFQVRLIRGSFAARMIRTDLPREPYQRDAAYDPAERGPAAHKSADPAGREPASDGAQSQNPVGSSTGTSLLGAERLTLTQARYLSGRLADRLVQQAIRDPDGTPDWLTLTTLPGTNLMQIGLLTDSLYDGRLGVAISLKAVAGTQRAQNAGGSPSGGEAPLRVGPSNWDFADQVLRPLRDRDSGPDPANFYRYLRDQPIGFAGIGGLLRGWHAVAAPGPNSGRTPDILRDRRDRPATAQFVERIPQELVRRDLVLDLVGGAAGLIAPVAASYLRQPTAHGRELLVAAAKVLANAQSADGSWRCRAFARPLAGYSHGAAGIGLAMLEAGAALDDPRFVGSGAAGLAWEARQFDTRRGVWPDLRGGDGQGLLDAWCHGAAGIALSRMRAQELLPEHPDAEQWQADLARALDIISDPAPGGVDQLCCGNMGRAAVLIILGNRLDRPAVRELGTELALRTAARAVRRGGFTVTAGVDVPGLMTGLSGIGLLLASLGQEWDLAHWLV